MLAAVESGPAGTKLRMLIRRTPPFPVRASEITPERVYLDRRRVIAGLGAGAAVVLAGCGPSGVGAEAPGLPDAAAALADLEAGPRQDLAGGEALTSYESVTTYNNYYEFGTGKTDPARNAHTLRPSPWTVTVDGQCDAPGTLDVDTLIRDSQLEDRIYRFRCVETWSMVVPWVGVPLGSILQRFRPNSRAKYVAFETLHDPVQMPRAAYSGLQLPYVEGLRMDEALHPLAFVAVGLYGKVLPNQNGAPLRLVMPWKYGFKSIKSIVRIRFTERQPPTTWGLLASDEYGFFSNVQPDVPHPRWSQASERRLGELFKRPTLPFNGYPEVAELYAGMDPVVYF